MDNHIEPPEAFGINVKKGKRFLLESEKKTNGGGFEFHLDVDEVRRTLTWTLTGTNIIPESTTEKGYGNSGVIKLRFSYSQKEELLGVLSWLNLLTDAAITEFNLFNKTEGVTEDDKPY